VRLNCGITQVDPAAKTVTLEDGTLEKYDHLISTISLKELTKLMGIARLDQLAQKLKHTRVQVAGIAPNMPLPDDLQDKTWLYCPEEKASFYRVTPFSLFSPAHVPDPDNQCSMLCEISTHGDEPVPEPQTKEQVLNDLREIGLIDADPDNTHAYMMHAEYGYPIPTIDRDDILNELQPLLEELNIFSRGRFGGWKYEVANMDHSLMQGVECIDRILEGKEEKTLPDPNFVNSRKND
jgi:protoporphyrinogen oxidase